MAGMGRAEEFFNVELRNAKEGDRHEKNSKSVS
jgi:hypothetical protein